MKNHVTFLADGFNQTEQRPNFINDGNFGEDLAHWLIAEFKKFEDTSAEPEPLQEDWGWWVFVSTGQVCGSIGLGAYVVGTSHGDQDGWMCFWDPPKKSLVSRICGFVLAPEGCQADDRVRWKWFPRP